MTQDPHDPAGALLARLAELAGARAGATAVFGAPVERDGVTVIPVATSRVAFGGGHGPAPDGGGEGGGGGGLSASRPLGFIEIRDGRARFRRVTDPATFGVAAVSAAVAAAILVRVAGRCGGRRRGRP
jgi:uncharacterized spore protein YtfJ